MACQSINIRSALTRQVADASFSIFSRASMVGYRRQEPGKIVLTHGTVVCSAIQESSTAAVTDVKKQEVATTKAAAPAANDAPGKPKKPPVKPLPEMMEEEVIPSLKECLEVQEDVSEIEISFQDNRLQGSFQKKGIPYSFWAFFPNGVLTGPKGFSLSSYGSGVSTVEPFLIDEKRINAKLVVFWVKKRLAAQGILPVWTE
ncbi:hypothetical protein OPV22_008710 [Ensete ventricosum]|uniref:Uncharacterized protein n=1 Tax=Ensete ventricosum TaxID=4639 RepID=A0AAV8R3K3_ENSVE|nr:hypothetical protein OPV22_008710 [Ensete ventricosum]RWW25587.1 hypothetical protein GW17_00010061 [Ensete ventricosum]RWW66665.1 hypothetical protein BHE74_00025951 [Ensete ventricosum]RZS02479.1 hypothetical protein BHM03_00032532 [Ensete ventricosum]